MPNKLNLGKGGCKLNNMEIKARILLIQGYYQLQREFEASLEELRPCIKEGGAGKEGEKRGERREIL